MIFITARWGGAEVRGEIGLFILNVSLLTILLNVFTGSGMVYLFKQQKFPKMPGYAFWNGLVLGLVLAIIFVLIYPYSLIESLFFLGTIIFQIFFNWQQQLFFSKENFNKINQMLLIQSLTQLIVFFLLYYILSWQVDYCFYLAYTVSFLTPCLISKFDWTLLHFPRFEYDEYTKVVFTNNGIIQLNTLLGLLNIRAVYWLLAYVSGMTSVGIFNIAFSVIDLLLIYPKSGAAILYAKAAGSKNAKVELQKIFKSEIPTLILLSCIIGLIPSNWGAFVFGYEFQSSFEFLPWLIPYFFIFAINSYLIHYFSALGKNRFNLNANIFGLALFIVGICTYLPISHLNSIYYLAVLLSICQLGIFILLKKYSKN
jgi:O-antigen/teichoic acid export membrane protein